MYSENSNYNNLSPNQKPDSICATGSSETFSLLSDDCDIKVDILAQRYGGTSIWGQIKDECGQTIPGAFVKLIKPVYQNNEIEYISISKCVSDSNGFYQFNLETINDDSAYKIIVSKIITTPINANTAKDYKNSNYVVPSNNSYSKEDITNRTHIQF
ncbi:MAG: hypothetical protein ACRCWG_11965 [Sarcina sp.]